DRLVGEPVPGTVAGEQQQDDEARVEAASERGGLPRVASTKRISSHQPASSALQIAHDPETESCIGGVDVRRGAPGRAGLGRRTGPGTAADDLVAAAGIDPGRTVTRRAPVAVVPAVGDPLADV